jgi:membrane-bound ClpP family serine protease
MNLLLDPNVAYLLLVGGFIVAILALFSPGTGLLEIGALFMLFLAGYSIYNLAFNSWALLVLILGVFPFLLALRKSRQWIFLALSLLALVVGSVFMFRQADGAPAINPWLAFLVSLLSVTFLWMVGRRGIEAIDLPLSHDLQRLPGLVGQAHTDIFQEGSAYVAGEEWSARSEVKIPLGSRVRVISRDGLVLTVEPLPSPVSREGKVQ